MRGGKFCFPPQLIGKQNALIDCSSRASGGGGGGGSSSGSNRSSSLRELLGYI